MTLFLDLLMIWWGLHLAVTAYGFARKLRAERNDVKRNQV
jgi:hypothetical protein